MEVAIALLPLLAFVGFITILRLSLIKAALLSLAVMLLTTVYWDVARETIGGASVRGVFIALEIGALLFAALILINILRQQKTFEHMRQLISHITSDVRFQVLLIGLAFISLVEGAAGFGTPALFAIPLFLAIGFKPLHAVFLALLGDSVPVIFGAVGLPVTLGIGSVLEPISSNAESLTDQATITIGLINIFSYAILANLLVWFALRIKKQPMSDFISFIPVASISGALIGVTSFAAAVLLGPSLPSIIGGLIGFVLIAAIARFHERRQRKAHETTSSHQALSDKTFIIHALVPYGFLVALLLITRLESLPFSDWLQNITVGLNDIFGSDVSYTLAPLYTPAAILLLTAVVAGLFARYTKQDISFGAAAQDAFRHTLKPLAVLLPILVFVQLFIFSDPVDGGDSIPLVIADSSSSLTGPLWPLFAPLIGAIGSFVSGSATVSNLIFTSLQYDIALDSGLSERIMLSLQGVGAAAGNMVAVHNVVAALTIAGISHNKSHMIIRRTVKPLLIFLAVYGVIGLVLS